MEHQADGLIRVGLFAGAATTFSGVISFTEWLAIIGVLLTVATFIVNWYYKRAYFKIAREKWEMERDRMDRD